MRVRPPSIQRRLMTVFTALAIAMMVLTWLIGVVWFFKFEREELIQNLRSQAAMLATNAVAGVMFVDLTSLAEDIQALRHQKAVDWAVILGPDAELARYGSPPRTLAQLREEFGAGNNVIQRVDSLVVRQPIVYQGTPRGEIILHADLGESNAQFLGAATSGLVVVLVMFIIASRAFARSARSLSMPFEELARLAEMATADIGTRERARVLSADEAGRTALAFNRMLDALGERERRLARSRDELRALTQRLQSVREDERRRIARELHDELGQRLTALKLGLVRDGMPADAGALGQIGEAIQQVRNLAWQLRPGVLDTLGLATAVEWLAQDFQQRMGLRCTAEIDDDGVPVADELATDVFRICQELLTNVARHAEASRVHVRLKLGSTLVLEVEDNGRGMAGVALASSSLGLLGIRERAGRWGGRVEFVVPAGGGLCARLEIPRPAMTHPLEPNA